MPNQEIEKKETLASLLSKAEVQRRFADALGSKSPAFVSSVLSLYNATPQLATADPRSILSAAMMAATLDLPVNKNLGFSAIVPYGNQAQFQIMAKGFVQLGLRSGQYKTLHVTEVYKDEIQSWNPLTGEFVATPFETWKLRDGGKQEDIAGYLAYMKLHNGFEKYLYWTVAQVQAHGKKYSKSYGNPNGQWLQNFNAMALKTMIKMLLNKWGVLSVQMEKAIEVDQGVVDTTGIVSYDDRPEDEPVATKPTGASKKLNDDQHKLLCARITKSGIEMEEVMQYLKGKYGVEHKHDLTVEQLSEAVKWLEQEPGALA